MKFSVERDVLTDAVAWAARSLPVRPSVPVLAGLLIETNDSGDGLVLSTFDYETSARATVPAAIQDEGKALVSGRLLADICRSLPQKPVHMAIDGAKVCDNPPWRSTQAQNLSDAIKRVDWTDGWKAAVEPFHCRLSEGLRAARGPLEDRRVVRHAADDAEDRLVSVGPVDADAERPDRRLCLGWSVVAVHDRIIRRARLASVSTDAINATGRCQYGQSVK